MYRFTLITALLVYRFTPAWVYRFTPEKPLNTLGFPQERNYSESTLDESAFGLKATAGRLVGSTRRPPVASPSFRPG